MKENDRLSKLEKRVDEIVKEIEELFDRPSRAKQETIEGYSTVIEYMEMYGIDLSDVTQAILISKDAAALSRDQGYEMRKADDERFGVVNSYHVDVLDQVFQL